MWRKVKKFWKIPKWGSWAQKVHSPGMLRSHINWNHQHYWNQFKIKLKYARRDLNHGHVAFQTTTAHFSRLNAELIFEIVIISKQSTTNHGFKSKISGWKDLLHRITWNSIQSHMNLHTYRLFHSTSSNLAGVRLRSSWKKSSVLASKPRTLSRNPLLVHSTPAILQKSLKFWNVLTGTGNEHEYCYWNFK